MKGAPPFLILVIVNAFQLLWWDPGVPGQDDRLVQEEDWNDPLLLPPPAGRGDPAVQDQGLDPPSLLPVHHGVVLIVFSTGIRQTRESVSTKKKIILFPAF